MSQALCISCQLVDYFAQIQFVPRRYFSPISPSLSGVVYIGKKIMQTSKTDPS